MRFPVLFVLQYNDALRRLFFVYLIFYVLLTLRVTICDNCLRRIFLLIPYISLGVFVCECVSVHSYDATARYTE